MYLLWGFNIFYQIIKHKIMHMQAVCLYNIFFNFPLWHACGSFKNVFQIEIMFLLLKMRLISAA